MPYRWPTDTDFAPWELDVLDRDCPACGRMMHICDHRYRRFHTLDGPVELVCKLNHCPDPALSGTRQDQEPRTRSHHRPAQVGHRLGRLLLDRTSPLLTPLGDLPDPSPNSSTTTGSSSPKTPSASTSAVTRPCSPRGSKTPRPCAGSTKRSTRSSSRSTASSPRRDTRPSTWSGS